MTTKSGSMSATFVRMCSFAADFRWMYFAQSMQLSESGIREESTAYMCRVLNRASEPRLLTFLKPGADELILSRNAQ